MRRNNLQILIIWPLISVGLYLMSLYNYILFHVVAESFSIVIAISLFMIAWNTRQLAKNNYVLFLSIAFLFAGLIDFVHTLAYKGMGIFQGFDANLPTQLWIIARYLQSLSLLAAPWFIDRKLNIRAVLGFYFALTLFLLATVFFSNLFPDCFIEGMGLTPFKIVSEYIICLILIASLVLLLLRREKFDQDILRLIVWSIIFTIVSELAFTFYISVYGLSNMVGHLFKIFSFYLIYRAIIVTGLENPYRLLFYDLQKNREELQTIIDSSPIMIFYKDLENKFIRVNRALAEATGLAREEIEGRTAFEVYPNQATDYLEDDKEVIASGKPKTGIIEPIGTEMGTRWVQTDKIPYRDMGGRIIGIIGFSIDITERKRMEEELLKADKLESVGILAGGIAHDFNNILTSILGNISIAKMQVKPGQKVFDLLNAAETSSINAQALTRQLLTFAKGGAPVKETALIKKLIKESSLFVLRGSKSECEFHIAENLWPVEADLGQISQVISNIAINANQAMPEGGIIRIVAENMMPEKVREIPVKPRRYIHISIKDQGAGIDEKLLSKIFDPYFTTKRAGSGLGLATAYSIIKKHNGHISVNSRLGEGTTFHLYLPASDKEVPIKEEAVILTGHGKILMMDDDMLLKEMAKDMLAMLGYESEFAKDGDEAIEMYKKAMGSEKPYDAVILDLTIPGGMGGEEAIKILLEIDPEVKAIVFSGYSEGKVMSNFRKYGFKGMMPKPFDSNALAKVLNDVLKENKLLKEI